MRLLRPIADTRRRSVSACEAFLPIAANYQGLLLAVFCLSGEAENDPLRSVVEAGNQKSIAHQSSSRLRETKHQPFFCRRDIRVRTTSNDKKFYPVNHSGLSISSRTPHPPGSPADIPSFFGDRRPAHNHLRHHSRAQAVAEFHNTTTLEGPGWTQCTTKL